MRVNAEPDAASPVTPGTGPASALTPGSDEERAKAAEVLKGCRMVMAEVQGLDFPRREVELYFKAATKLPKEWAGLEGQEKEDALASVRNVVELMVKVDEDGDKLPASCFKDFKALQLTQAMMFDLWRWRRLGGGQDSEQLPHQAALQDIQRYKPEDIERITSSLLDSLPISEEQKFEMSGAVEGVAMNAVNGAVWGSIVVGLGVLVLFNFARGF